MSNAPFEFAAALDEIPEGGRKEVFIDDTPALLLRVGNEYFAVEDVCTHDGQPLTDGPVTAGQIVCPRHGAKFDLATGEPRRMPATAAIRTFAVEIRADGVYVSSDPRPATPVPTEVAPSSAASATASATATTPAAEVGTGGSPGAGSSVTDEAVIEALREVIDPELMINIVDLGLVYSIQHEEQHVAIEMTLTSPACPAGPQIVQQSRMALERIPGVEKVDIKLTMTPPWSPDRMTDEARDQLGFF